MFQYKFTTSRRSVLNVIAEISSPYFLDRVTICKKNVHFLFVLEILNDTVINVINISEEKWI